MRRCAICCRVSRSRGTADFTQLANWLGERAAHRSMDPRSDRLRLPCCADVSCTPDGRNAASAGPCSSYDRGGYAWRGSLELTGCATVRASSARRAFRRRWASTACESRRDPGSRLSSPRLRAAESCRLRVMVLTSSRPSVGSARKGEGQNPARSVRLRRGHRGGGVTPVEVRHRPRSQNQ
jgi:hypothetical protein